MHIQFVLEQKTVTVFSVQIFRLFSLPGRSPGRAIVQPPALVSALASVLVLALALASMSVVASALAKC